MGSSGGPGARHAVHPVARIRLERVPASALAEQERPPVFHVFEELYARTLREMRAGTGAALATGRR